MQENITITWTSIADQYWMDLEYWFTAIIQKQSNHLFCTITYPQLSKELKNQDNETVDSILHIQRTEMIFTIVADESFKKFWPHYEEKIRNNGWDISEYTCEIK